MQIGSKIAMSGGKEGWPVQKAIYRTECRSNFRDTVYLDVFDRWETVGFFDTKEEAQDFIDKR